MNTFSVVFRKKTREWDVCMANWLLANNSDNSNTLVPENQGAGSHLIDWFSELGVLSINNLKEQ